MKTTFVFAALLSIILLPAGCKETQGINAPTGLEHHSNQIIVDWNTAIFEALSGPAADHTLLVSRIGAMTHIAIHDALNAIVPRYQTYAFHEKNKQADPIAAAASAAYQVLVLSVPAQKTMLDARLAASLAKVPEGKSKTEGIELGKKSAAAILALRQNDGALQDPISPLAPSTGQPGLYQTVPPFPFIFAPFWATMRPFSLEKADQFRIEPMPTLSSQKYTDDFNEVKRMGQKNSAARSAEQAATAKFWYEYSEIGWNRVTRVAAADKKLELLASARLFALVNMALADAYTAGWDSKVHYNFWRPYTAIRTAEIDNNPNTVADLEWEPAEITPPIQDYPSTHSALGNAAATVLAGVLGDQTKFTIGSATANPADATRTFYRFSEAANQNAESRVLGGLHFRFSCVKGQELGTKIGKWTLDNRLRPVN